LTTSWPAAHAASHASGAADAIKLDDLAAGDDNTDLNATTLRHGLLAFGTGEACFLGHLAVEQEIESRLESVWASRGWALARFEPRVSQAEGGAFTSLKALQLAEEHQRVDTHSRVVFEGPDGQLEQLHKAIADGRTASFYTIIARDTVDQDFAQNRQRFLAEQGYSYQILDVSSI
jgi:hypothetical protein